MTVQDPRRGRRHPRPALGPTAEAATPARRPGPRHDGSRHPRRRHQTWRTALRKDWRLYSFLRAAAALLRWSSGTCRCSATSSRSAGSARAAACSATSGWACYYVQMFINDPAFWQVFPTRVILGGLTLLVVLPAADHPGADAQRGPVAPRSSAVVQTISYLPHFMSVVIVAGHRLPAHRRRRHGQPGHRGGRRARPIAFMQEPELVPHHLRDVGGLADRRLGHDPLPRRAHDDRRAALRGRPDRRRQPVAADLARHAARHPPDDGRAAHPQHRHVHGGGLREDPAALQPADLLDGRRHLDLPVPGRHRLDNFSLRHGDRPVRGASSA